jgi:hypothetical protein
MMGILHDALGLLAILGTTYVLLWVAFWVVVLVGHILGRLMDYGKGGLR